MNESSGYTSASAAEIGDDTDCEYDVGIQNIQAPFVPVEEGRPRCNRFLRMFERKKKYKKKLKQSQDGMEC